MFHTISKNPPDKIGKIFSDQSYIGKSTTYATGREDWNVPFVSHTHTKFNVRINSEIICIILESGPITDKEAV